MTAKIKLVKKKWSPFSELDLTVGDCPISVTEYVNKNYIALGNVETYPFEAFQLALADSLANDEFFKNLNNELLTGIIDSLTQYGDTYSARMEYPLAEGICYRQLYDALYTKQHHLFEHYKTICQDHAWQAWSDATLAGFLLKPPLDAVHKTELLEIFKKQQPTVIGVYQLFDHKTTQLLENITNSIVIERMFHLDDLKELMHMRGNMAMSLYLTNTLPDALEVLAPRLWNIWTEMEEIPYQNKFAWCIVMEEYLSLKEKHNNGETQTNSFIVDILNSTYKSDYATYEKLKEIGLSVHRAYQHIFSNANLLDTDAPTDLNIEV